MENGFDVTHIYIPLKSILLQHNNMILLLGFAPTDVSAIRKFRLTDDFTSLRGGGLKVSEI